VSETMTPGIVGAIAGAIGAVAGASIKAAVDIFVARRQGQDADEAFDLKRREELVKHVHDCEERLDKVMARCDALQQRCDALWNDNLKLRAELQALTVMVKQAGLLKG
jgi:hypothetical protein